MIQPNYCALNSAKFLKRQSKVRVETGFPDVEEVKKPISVFAKSFITSRENSAEKTTVKAKVSFTFVYLSDDGYKKVNAECDAFSELDADCSFVESFVTDVKLLTSNGFIGVASVVFVGCKKEENQFSVLQNSDGVVCKSKEIDVDIYYNEKQGDQLITDEFNLDFTVGEVLSYQANAYLTSVNCGLGKIILEGETLLTVKALPFSENNDIVKETKVIPFRYELESDDSLPDMKCFAIVNVSSTNLKIFADENKQKSSVSVDIKLAFSGVLVGSEKMTVVTDAYLKNFECDLKKVDIERLCFKERKRFHEKVLCQGEAALDGGRILAVLGECVNLVSAKSDGGVVTVDGIVKADVVFKNSDNGIVNVPCERPFTFDFSENGEIFGLNLCLSGLNARVRNGEIELETHLEVSYNSFENERFTCVEEITKLGERNRLGSAISVFVASAGDDLWDVAKRLGSDEEEILKYNGDLTFPLSGDERIILYRQKI